MIDERQKPTGKYSVVSVNGARLSYQERGAGLGLVLIHGSLADVRSWRAQIHPFSGGFRVVAYSRRGHYPASWEDHWPDYTAGLHADDLAGLIEVLELAPAFLAGSSYGAIIALLLAVKRPELVRGLVLGEPPLLPWLADRPETRPFYDQFIQNSWDPCRAACQAGDPKGAARSFLDGVNGPGTFQRLSPRAWAAVRENLSELCAEAKSRHIFPDLTRMEVAALQAPVLLLSGEKSPALFHAILDELQANLPSVTRVEIPHTSHTIHRRNPGAYNQVVMEWLSGLSKFR